MTSEELQAIHKRLNRATLGPWSQDCLPTGACGAKCYSNTIRSEAKYPNPVICEVPHLDGGKHQQVFDDMIFIAHARQDIPALLREMNRLRAELDGLHASLSSPTTCA